MGWYAKDDSVRTAPINKGMGSQFLSPGDPERMYNSIQDPINNNLPFFGGDWIEFEDTWDAEAAATAVKAYAVTITAFRANASGHMTAWAGGDAPMPAVSNVNFQKGVAAPNMAIVPAGHYTPDEHRIPHRGRRERHGAPDRRPARLLRDRRLPGPALQAPRRVLTAADPRHPKGPRRDGGQDRCERVTPGGRERRGPGLDLRRRQHHRGAAVGADVPDGVERCDGDSSGREHPQPGRRGEPGRVDLRTAVVRRRGPPRTGSTTTPGPPTSCSTRRAPWTSTRARP